MSKSDLHSNLDKLSALWQQVYKRAVDVGCTEYVQVNNNTLTLAWGKPGGGGSARTICIRYEPTGLGTPLKALADWSARERADAAALAGKLLAAMEMSTAILTTDVESACQTLTSLLPTTDQTDA